MVYDYPMSKFIYMAGLIDGEGTIGVSRDHATRNRVPYLSVSSTTKEIIDWLVENFGGTASVQKVYQDHHKQSWSWKLRNKAQLFELIAQIEPHMLEPAKKARIKMLLTEYQTVTPRNGKYTPEMTAAKIDFEERLLALK